MDKSRIVIILGTAHLRTTPGKCSPDGKFFEAIYSRERVEAIAAKLRAYGYRVVIDYESLEPKPEWTVARKKAGYGAEQQKELEEQQLAMVTQANRIDLLIGIRKTMITDLSTTLSNAGINAKVDENGDIVLDSSVFFETNKSAIRPEGQALLNRFIPVYLSVLLRDEYSDYLGEIIIEGHTDSTGTYEKNLELSQDRALQVALYCLDLPGLTPQQKAKLQQILTAKGRSSSDLIYDENGLEDKDASRRVEFKFSLKDAQMIEEMNRILNQQGQGDE